MMGDEVWKGNFPYGLFEQIIRYLSGVINVDIQATERSKPIYIDTGTATSPATVIVPSPGSAIETRGVYLTSDSSSGTVFARYAITGSIIGVLFCSKFSYQHAERLNVPGDVDEPIIVEWDGLSTHAKIYALITYKEV